MACELRAREGNSRSVVRIPTICKNATPPHAPSRHVRNASVSRLTTGQEGQRRRAGPESPQAGREEVDERRWYASHPDQRNRRVRHHHVTTSRSSKSRARWRSCPEGDEQLDLPAFGLALHVVLLRHPRRSCRRSGSSRTKTSGIAWSGPHAAVVTSPVHTKRELRCRPKRTARATRMGHFASVLVGYEIAVERAWAKSSASAKARSTRPKAK